MTEASIKIPLAKLGIQKLIDGLTHVRQRKLGFKKILDKKWQNVYGTPYTCIMQSSLGRIVAVDRNDSSRSLEAIGRDFST